MDPMLSGMSLQTLLNLNPSLLLSDSFLTDHPPLQSPIKPLLLPKPEQQHFTTASHPQPQPQPQQPFTFFPKRPRLDHYSTYRQHPSTTTSYYSSPDTSSSSSSSTSPSSFRAKQPSPFSSSSSVIPQSNLARQRRQKLSEKTRCLQKLMPWDKKMDQATLLEEAYKYVKFLQAQVTVLQSMPLTSPPSSFKHMNNNNNGNGGVVFGDLERLSRNQVLQVLVNSPVAQTVMSSKGLCVFSTDQLGMLTKLSKRRLLIQHMNDINSINIVPDSKPNFFT